jgi:Mn2+/Fe2+ NRAMP family transporter
MAAVSVGPVGGVGPGALAALANNDAGGVISYAARPSSC